MFRIPLPRLPLLPRTSSPGPSTRTIGTFRPTRPAAAAKVAARERSKKGDTPAYTPAQADDMDKLADAIEEQPAAAINLTTTRVKLFQPDSAYPPWELLAKNRIEQNRPRQSIPRLGPPRKIAREYDPFYQLSYDPLDEYRNVTLLGAYVSEMGRIQPRAVTGLTWRSQRKVGQAIRRAKAMGLMPVWSRPRHYNPRGVLRLNVANM